MSFLNFHPLNINYLCHVCVKNGLLMFYLRLFSRKPRVLKMDTEQVKPFFDVVTSCSPDFRNGKLKSCKDHANGESWQHNNKSLCDLIATFLNIHHNFHYAPLLSFLLLLGDDWFCSQKSLHWNWFLWAHNFSSCFHECYEAYSNKWILIINCTEFLDVRGNAFSKWVKKLTNTKWCRWVFQWTLGQFFPSCTRFVLRINSLNSYFFIYMIRKSF